jgi:hypothetical protein
LKTVPEVRARLLEIAEELQELERQLWRRPAVRRAKAEHNKMTPRLAFRVRRYASANPSMSYAKIGRVFNVHPGRVSEVVAGKR